MLTLVMLAGERFQPVQFEQAGAYARLTCMHDQHAMICAYIVHIFLRCNCTSVPG